MSILLSRIVTRKENIQPGDGNKEHGRPQNVARGIGSDSDAINSMRCIKVDGFNKRKGGEVVVFGVKGCPLVRRGCSVANSDIILDQPFIDGLGSVCCQNSTFEIGLAEHVWESRRVVDVETAKGKSS